MENKMINIFLFSLLLTFLLVRMGAHYLHDKKNYNTKKEKSRTITFWLRRKTGYNIHHIHIGLLMILIILPLIIFKELTIVLIGALGVSLSLIADQTLPLFSKNISYFDKKNLIAATLLHLLIITIALISKIS